MMIGSHLPPVAAAYLPQKAEPVGRKWSHGIPRGLSHHICPRRVFLNTQSHCASQHSVFHEHTQVTAVPAECQSLTRTPHDHGT